MKAGSFVKKVVDYLDSVGSREREVYLTSSLMSGDNGHYYLNEAPVS